MNKPEQVYEFARKYLVAGVSSSTRVNQALGYPLYVSRGSGPKIYDLEDNEYIDFCVSHGASILGHNHPKIKEAINKASEMGIICSHETEYQSRYAQKICQLVPAAELVRFTCSGTEATMYCIRLAREYTGKDKIIKFEGHFHGYHDYVMYSSTPPLDKIGPEDSPIPYPQSGGMPDDIKKCIIVLPFNNQGALEKAIKKYKDEVAAVILEPVNYNSGCIIPARDYIKAIRDLTEENDILLVFDEVLSAFRMCSGGAQEYLGITPDLCTLGKSVAGGTPLSVFTGRRDIMEHVRPLGESEHSGTYNGHLICVLAGLACLNEISSPGFYNHINQLADRLYTGFNQIFERQKVKGRVQGLGARFGIFFGIDEEVTNYRMAAKNDSKTALKFFASALKNGIYFADYGGKACHHGFSSAHTIEDIDNALDRIETATKEIRK